MSLDHVTATDAILSTLKVKWDADTPALNSGVAPTLVYEFLESDMKPHPRDSGKAWTRVTVRHTDGQKASLRNSDGVARYRRQGFVWVQVFVPYVDASSFTTSQQLAQVALRAYEGKRSTDGNVVFTRTQLIDSARDGAWVRRDVKSYFYWDEIR